MTSLASFVSALSTIRRPVPNVNVKKLQFIHTLTATDVRTSKTAKIKIAIMITAEISRFMEEDVHRSAYVVCLGQRGWVQ